MAAAPGRPRLAGRAAGVVGVRLDGSLPDLAALALVLGDHAAVEILTGPDGPYPNHRGPGERVYLTVRIALSQRGAGAPSPSNPPAPLPLTETPLTWVAHSRQAICQHPRRHLP